MSFDEAHHKSNKPRGIESKGDESVIRHKWFHKFLSMQSGKVYKAILVHAGISHIHFYSNKTATNCKISNVDWLTQNCNSIMSKKVLMALYRSLPIH